MKTARKNRIKKQELRIKNRFLSCSRFIIHNSKFIASGGGFTLVEIIVAITILTTLIVVAVTALNPKGQLDKAKDAVRQNDLRTISAALDIYYYDKNCYPLSASSKTNDFADALTNGTEWKDGSTIYMKKVPTDPVSRAQYIYITDTTACPQWSTVFSKLSKQPTVAAACPLSNQSNCVPQSYDSSWACKTSGVVNCPVLLASNLSPAGSNATVTPGVTGTPTPTPTPISSDQYFTVAQPPGTTPQFYEGTISPLFQQVGNTQTLTVNVAGVSADVSSVSATVKSDTKTQTYDAAMTTGTPADGTWVASWTVNDTTIKRYVITLDGKDVDGILSTFDISIR